MFDSVAFVRILHIHTLCVDFVLRGVFSIDVLDSKRSTNDQPTTNQRSNYDKPTINVRSNNDQCTINQQSVHDQRTTIMHNKRTINTRPTNDQRILTNDQRTINKHSMNSNMFLHLLLINLVYT